MQVPNSHRHLSSVEPDSVLIKPFVGLVYLVQLTSLDEGHDEVESHLVLKQVVHAHKERVVALKHDVLLKQCVFDLVKLNQDVFADGFDCVQLLVLAQLSQENLAKCSSAQNHQHFEVFKLGVWHFVHYRVASFHHFSASVLFLLLLCKSTH